MKTVKSILIISIVLLIGIFSNNISFAQATDQPKEKAEAKGGICDCLKGAVDAIQKAYVSLEEDEWPTAIKTSKDTLTAIDTLSKTCNCPETVAYKKVAEAFLKYAEGGDHLDGADEPNCPYATKLYADAITLLDAYIPKITNTAVKENAEDIKGYLKEEKEFVDEECEGAQAEEKPKGAAGAKKQ